MAAHSPASLLGLPPELRVMIYELVVGNDEEVLLFDESTRLSGLLGACALVRREASPIYFDMRRRIGTKGFIQQQAPGMVAANLCR